jgi:hypothetical protein
MPIADAGVVLEQLSGVKLPPATLDREAKRQGQRAQRLRTQLDEQAATDPRQLELTLEPYQMIIQLDAWSLRERDDWGQSARLRRQGIEPERWHWVYTGTVFRLDHRGQTAGGRPVITERRDGGQRDRLPEGASGSDGLPGWASGWGTDRQRGGGSDLSAGAVPVQAARAILEFGWG